MDDYKSDEIFNELFRAYKERCISESYNIGLYRGAFKKANTQSNPNSLKVEEALIIMLQVVHSFKYLIDLYNNDDSEDDSDERNAKKQPFRITSGSLSSLLIEVLYNINGTYYSTRNPDYDLEGELDEILELPNFSFELDSAITKFLLLPLYFSTHSDQEDEEE